MLGHAILHQGHTSTCGCQHVHTFRQLPPAQEQLDSSGVSTHSCGLVTVRLTPPHSCVWLKPFGAKRFHRCTNQCMEHPQDKRTHFSSSCEAAGCCRGTSHLQQVACTSYSCWSSSELCACRADRQSGRSTHRLRPSCSLPATPPCPYRATACCLTAACLPDRVTATVRAVTAAARFAACTAAGSALPPGCAARLLWPGTRLVEFSACNMAV